jgi:hypothetical protein
MPLPTCLCEGEGRIAIKMGFQVPLMGISIPENQACEGSPVTSELIAVYESPG